MKKIFGIMIVVFILVGCSAEPGVNQEQKGNDKLSVVASFYPLAYMAERIGGDAVEVKNIIGAADPHDYMPGPSDVTAIADADLVILQGAEFEPWGDDIVVQLESADKPVVEVAPKLTLMKRGKSAHEHEEHAHENEHEDMHEHEDEHKNHVDRHEEEHEHEDEHEYKDEHADEHEDDHGHAHGAYDPHTWLDPVLAGNMVDVIADAMAEADPENAEMFLANAAKLNQEFDALDKSYEEGLANCTRDEVIVSHNALGYPAKRYDFTTHAIAGISTQDEPSAEVLAELKDEAAEGITHILTEENAVKRFSQTLASETGLAMLSFNPLATPAADGADFFDRAHINLVQLQTALGCN